MFNYIPREYLHFDRPVSKEVAEQFATDLAAVASHSFYPFIQYEVISQKIRVLAALRGGFECNMLILSEK